MARATKNSLTNPTTTLSAPISAGASSASIVSTTELPTTGTFSVNIGNTSADQEIIDCTYNGTTTLTFVGTTTKSHASGDPVNIVWTENDYTNFAKKDETDPLTQYALNLGRSTPQTLAFGTASGANTGYISSTSHATKGKYFLNAAGTITIDELNTRLGLGVASPGTDFEISGQAARTIRSARHTTSNTNGNTLTIQAGGATSGATNKNGGNLLLASGLSTGSGSGSVILQVPTNTAASTTDNTLATRLTVTFTTTTISNRLQLSGGLSSGVGTVNDSNVFISANLTNNMTNVQTTLDFDSAVDNSASPAFFPTSYPFLIFIGTEVITVTSLASGNAQTGTWNVVRGARDSSGSSTTPAAHTAGDVVQEVKGTGYLVSPNGTLSTNITNQSATWNVWLPPVFTSDGIPAPSPGQFFLITDSSGLAGSFPVNIISYNNAVVFTDVIDIPYGSLLVQYDSANNRYKRIARENSASATRNGKIGGTIFDHYSDAGNTTTSETDLYSDTTAAATLLLNGDKFHAKYALTILGSASSKQLKAYFGGTAIFESTALAIASNQSAYLEITIIRESSSVVRCIATCQISGTTVTTPQYTRVTGLTLGSTNILKITGTASGGAAATNDIVAKFGTVEFLPAA